MKKYCSVRLPIELIDVIKKMALTNHRSFTGQVIHLLTESLKIK